MLCQEPTDDQRPGPRFLTENRSECGLQAGDVGWVVMVHGGGAGYEVEFVTLAGVKRYRS
jgi:hypothetical protein